MNKIKPKGKFIVFYGINNLGKSTAAKLTVEKLKKEGFKAEYLKYPLYDLEPAGQLLNDYLRAGNPYNFTPREFQLLHYIDRIKYEETLIQKLKEGVNVIAEDYFGTALAWGIAAGVEEDLLKGLYQTLYSEDLAILFDGERYLTGIEEDHKHENDEELTKKTQEIFLKLQKEYNWQKINANQEKNKIVEEVYERIKGILGYSK
jgi:thymidylate kinase